MSLYYLDTSALAKRYFPESGTLWVESITNQQQQHTILLSEVTLAEMAAVISAKHRLSGGVTLDERDGILSRFLQDCNTDYHLIPINRMMIDRAVILTQLYRLRGYDAIQLAVVQYIQNVYRTTLLSSPVFVTADKDLLVAAIAEGIPTENPNAYP